MGFDSGRAMAKVTMLAVTRTLKFIATMIIMSFVSMRSNSRRCERGCDFESRSKFDGIQFCGECTGFSYHVCTTNPSGTLSGVIRIRGLLIKDQRSST